LFANPVSSLWGQLKMGALKTVAVVLAGGTGTRVGLDTPKQLLKIAGKTILEHALDAFEAHPGVEEILLVMVAGGVETAERLVAAGGYRKVTEVIEGGQERAESTRRAIAALTGRMAAGTDCNVLFHDAVRPLVEQRIITDCIAVLATESAVDVAIPSADTVIRLDDSGRVAGIPPRDRLRRGQTPQGFRLSVIRHAYELASADPAAAQNPVTDDCGVLLRYLPDVPIAVVAGSERNMKVTHPIDVFVAEKLFQLTSESGVPPLSASEYRGKLDGRTMVIFGGSHGIGADIRAVAEHFGAKVWSFTRSQTGTHVESPAEVEAALKQAYQSTGRIDFVINTAGLLRIGNLADMDPEDVAEIVNVNLLGPATIARAALRYLARTHGQLLLYTSSSYTRGRAGYSMYSASKAAVVNLTQALADEWSDVGVRVNCINPERTQTPMRTRAFGEEPPGTLLNSTAVALTSIDVLVSGLTGHIVDVRLADPTVRGAHAFRRPIDSTAPALAPSTVE
jgi:ribitol-5-phosphate 2-dehydrogenase (NADP+) / D-ribitol-5-phosphate cytidylyltransferase